MKTSLLKTITTLAIGMLLGATTIAAAAPGTIQAAISNFKIMIDGQEHKLKNQPLVVKGTTYLPVREVAGVLGKQVHFQSNTIHLTDAKEEEQMDDTIIWHKAIDIAEQYGISIVMDKETTVSYNGIEITFPLSIYGKDNEGKTYTNNEGTASLKTESSMLYLGNDTLKLLGIQ